MGRIRGIPMARFPLGQIISAAAIGLVLGAAPSAARAASLNLYSAQHEQTVDLLTKAFTKETGIEVKVHAGEAPELASQLVKEGASSPADVFFTENSPSSSGCRRRGFWRKSLRRRWRAAPLNTMAPPGTGSAFSPARTCWRSIPARSRRRTCRRRSWISRSRTGRARSPLLRLTPISCRWLGRWWR